MFFYTLAIPYTLRWLTFGRRRPRDIATAFLAILFVFGGKPLLVVFLGASFNTQTGEAQECYSWNGESLSISERPETGCGIDPVTGKITKELTAEIAAILARQSEPPKPIDLGMPLTQFFDPASGRPAVWYAKNADGSYSLYDSDGFSPKSGKRLKPVTPEIVDAIRDESSVTASEELTQPSSSILRMESSSSTTRQLYLSHPVNLDPNGDNWVALRSEPEFRGYRMDKLGPNARFRIVLERNGWTNVELPDGRKGWISSRFVGTGAAN